MLDDEEFFTNVRKIFAPPLCGDTRKGRCTKCCWYCTDLRECIENWGHQFYTKTETQYYWCKYLKRIRWCSIVKSEYHKMMKEVMKNE